MRFAASSLRASVVTSVVAMGLVLGVVPGIAAPATAASLVNVAVGRAPTCGLRTASSALLTDGDEQTAASEPVVSGDGSVTLTCVIDLGVATNLSGFRAGLLLSGVNRNPLTCDPRSGQRYTLDGSADAANWSSLAMGRLTPELAGSVSGSPRYVRFGVRNCDGYPVKAYELALYSRVKVDEAVNGRVNPVLPPLPPTPAEQYVATSSVAPPSRAVVQPGPTTITAGYLTKDTVWGPEGSPYVVTRDMAINDGATLTILPGTIVKFGDGTANQGAGFSNLNGRLLALGTADKPIVFTSLRDDTVAGDTNGDGAASSPSMGDWHGIELGINHADIADHVVVRYAGSLGTGGQCPYGYNVKQLGFGSYLTNSRLTDSLQLGLQQAGGQHWAGAYRNTFAGNGCGVRTNGGEVIDNTFTGSRALDMYGDYPHGVVAHFNTLTSKVTFVASSSAEITTSHADVSLNNLTAGVDHTFAGNDLVLYPNNYWGAPLPAVPTGCVPTSAEYSAPATTVAAAPADNCASGRKYTGTYDVTVKPALRAVPPASLLFARQLGPRTDGVNAATGALHIDAEDLSLADAGGSLASRRAYDSDAIVSSDLGSGWTRAFSSALSGAGATQSLISDDGVSDVVTDNDAGDRIGNASDNSSLTNLAGVSTLTSPDGSTQTFDANGRLIGRNDGDPDRTIHFTHDIDGKLSRVTGISGRTLDYTRNAAGQITRIEHLTGRAVTFGYAGGRLDSVTGVDGKTTHYGYDAAGRLDTVTRPDGLTAMRATYDNLGRVATYQLAGQALVTMDYHPERLYTLAVRGSGSSAITTRYDYDDLGRATRVGNVGGVATHYIYDGASRIVSTITGVPATAGNTEVPRAAVVHYNPKTGNPEYQISADNVVTRTTFDGNHRPLVTTWPDASQLTREYDANHRVIKQTDRYGKVTLFTYNTHGQVTSQSGIGYLGPLGWSYAPNGDLLSTTDRDGGTTAIDTDPLGRPTRWVDPTNRARRRTYTSWGAIQTDTQPSGALTTYSYDDDQRVTAVTTPPSSDAGPSITSFGYDSQGRLETTTDAIGRIASRLAYDAQGRVRTDTDARGYATVYDYNVDGQLVAITDPTGNSRRSTYDILGNTTSLTDERGFTTVWRYDVLDRLTSTTTADGATTTVTYNTDGLPSRSKNALGRETVYYYDSQKRLEKIFDTRYKFTSYTYDSAGLIRTVTDPSGRTVTNLYDSAGHRLSSSDQLGSIESRTYDLAGRLASTTNANGDTTRYDYDANGQLQTTTDAEGGEESMNRNAAGLVTSRKDQVGRIARYTYDRAGQARSEVTPRGITHLFDYDLNGNVTARTDELGNATRWEYDSNDRLTRITDPLGHVATRGYDAVGNLTRATDPTGVSNFTGYDSRNRVAVSSNALGGTRSQTFTLMGMPLATTDEQGATWTNNYDEGERLLSSVRTLPGQTNYDYHYDWFNYDEANRPHSRRLHNGYQLLDDTYNYDLRGRITQVCEPFTSCHDYTYDGMGQLQSETDPLHKTSFRTYDHAGRLRTTKDALGHVVQFGYDLAGQRRDVILPRGGVWHTDYDDDGNVSAVTDPLSRKTTYISDHENRLVDIAKPSGRHQTLTRDAAGRITRDEASNVAWENFGYDAAGRLTSASNPTDDEVFSYDRLGLLASAYKRTLDGGPRVESSRYTHDSAGRLASYTPTGGSAVAYSYSRAGDVTRVQGAPAGDGYYFRDVLNRYLGYSPTSATAPDPGDTYNYDRERLTDFTARGGTLSYVLRYDDADRLTQQWATSPPGSVPGDTSQVVSDYSYDDAGRLTQENRHTYNGKAIGGTSYRWDSDGNRDQVTTHSAGGGDTTVDYHYDAADQLNYDSTGTTYEYDADGNQTKTIPATRLGNIAALSAVPNVKTYDAFGRLSGANRIVSDREIPALKYSRDALGRLSSRTLPPAESGGVATLVTTLDYDGLSWNASRISEPDRTNRIYRDPIGGLLASTQSSGTASNPTSASARLSTNTHGDLVAAGTWLGLYDAFGQPAQQSTVTEEGIPTAQRAPLPLGYQGEYTDPLLGLVDAQNRGYDPTLGRFTQFDPIAGQPSSLPSFNRYGYGDANPITNSDPTGLSAWSAATNAVKSAGQGLVNVGRAIVNYAVEAASNLGTAVTQDGGYLDQVTGSNTYRTLKQDISQASERIVTSPAILNTLGDLERLAHDHRSLTATGASLLSGGLCELATGATPLCFGLANSVFQYLECSDADKATCAIDGAISGVAGGVAFKALGAIAPKALPTLLGRATQSILRGATSSVTTAATDQTLHGKYSGTDLVIAGLFGAGADLGLSSIGIAKSRLSARENLKVEPPLLRGSSAAEESGSLASAARTCSVNSFTGATLVTMADGSKKPIHDVKVGDKVLATDPETGQTAARPVTKLIVHSGKHTMVDVHLADGSTITATDRHPFWDATTGEFTYAIDLRPGDKVREIDGTLLAVSATRVYDEDVTAYNLTVDGIHTYYAGTTPVLVHNSCGEIPWSSSSVGRAAGELDRGASSATVASRSEAEEIFLGNYQGQGFTNTTGMSGREVREFFGSKAGTYHWDTDLTPGLPHSFAPHLQIHGFDGTIQRIFFGAFE
jgi:RHS repeat-associated protein